ncbi:uncharacterized protein LOC135838969 [Planococcus citri]|uniref:uncharacterized protein LOC135838969 n=1 Tax=Planococcus citri TaxID=170843 RepID=UPI0031F9F541
MEVLKCVIIQPGILILINFIFVSRALSREDELFRLYANNLTTIRSFEINEDIEDDEEYMARTFEPVAIHTLAMFKSVIGFYDELSAEIKEIKGEKIKRLENKIKQLEENDGPLEEENPNIEEEQLDLKILNNSSVKFDVYDEHEVQQLYYSSKIPDVLKLIKSNEKLIDIMQSVRNEIVADRYVSKYRNTKLQTLSESELKTAREVIFKLLEKEVPPKDIEGIARASISSINFVLEQHREHFTSNSEINEMDDKIRLLNERIREIEENQLSRSSQHIMHEEL